MHYQEAVRQTAWRRPFLRESGLGACPETWLRLTHIAGIGNGLAADFEDHVAVLEAMLGRRTVRLDGGDRDALVAGAGDFPRRRYLQPQMRNATGWLCATAVSLGLLFVRHFRQGRRDAPGARRYERSRV